MKYLTTSGSSFRCEDDQTNIYLLVWLQASTVQKQTASLVVKKNVEKFPNKARTSIDGVYVCVELCCRADPVCRG